MSATQVRRAIALLVLIGGVVGCPATPRAPRAWPWAERRASYIRGSAVWLGGDLSTWLRHMRTLDLAAGPSAPDGFAPGELVWCDYAEPRERPLGGNTPKFLCRRPRDGRWDTFKVKWGDAPDAEVYGDVAGSRLLWALGFGADRDYPVRVECTGCADDPWRDRRPHPGHVPAVFDPASIEREFDGITIEERPDQGWMWSELDRVDPSAGGAPRAHIDAFRLLAAFIQHRDSKASNQRLLCLRDGVGTAANGRWTCRRPFMMIQDLGSVFGGPALLSTRKMTFAAWTATPLWRDPTQCIAHLSTELDAHDGLEDPQIGDAGRRFLAALLNALDDDQLAGLFTAARADRRGADVRGWVEAFKARRGQVVSPVPSDPAFRCPTP